MTTNFNSKKVRHELWVLLVAAAVIGVGFLWWNTATVPGAGEMKVNDLHGAQKMGRVDYPTRRTEYPAQVKS